jgi:clan AA aspartic protease
MSIYRTNLRVANPRESSRESATVESLVDTGAELTWMPADLLEPVGIVRLKKRSFRTANGQILQRDVGYAIVRAEGYETIDEVVFGEPGDQVLLGVRTLEGFGVAVDPIGHRLVAQATLAAATGREILNAKG